MKPAVARAQEVLEPGTDDTGTTTDGITSTTGGAPLPGGETPTPAPEPKRPNRFFLAKQLDNARINRDVSELVSEIVSNLQNEKGCRVEISLEIQAYVPDQFSETTIRTITENCRVLKVQTAGFGES